MDEEYRREFGAAIRAAEGRPDPDGTIRMRRDRKTGRWVIGYPASRFGDNVIRALVFIGFATLVWLAS